MAETQDGHKIALYEQILDLLDSNDVEPNGELAKALRYFQYH